MFLLVADLSAVCISDVCTRLDESLVSLLPWANQHLPTSTEVTFTMHQRHDLYRKHVRASLNPLNLAIGLYSAVALLIYQVWAMSKILTFACTSAQKLLVFCFYKQLVPLMSMLKQCVVSICYALMPTGLYSLEAPDAITESMGF